MQKTEAMYFQTILALTADEAYSHQLARDLVESDTHPAAFYEKHKSTHFHNRGITAPGNDEQTLCYLLDELGEKEVVYELDWKADAEELNYAIKLLSRGKVDHELVDEDDEEDATEEGMFELLDVIEEPLREYGFGIVLFALESDSYPIAVVAFDQQEAIQTMIDDLF
jgi:hypothetical protein